MIAGQNFTPLAHCLNQLCQLSGTWSKQFPLQKKAAPVSRSGFQILVAAFVKTPIRILTNAATKLFLLRLALFFNRRLCGGKSGDGHSERTARNVGESDAMAEFHRIGVAAVFAADAELDVGSRLAALRDGDFHELADAGLVNRGERIFLHDLHFLIRAEEAAGIVAAHAERGLRQIVRAEAEELRRLRDLIGGQRAARNFDHRADAVSDLYLL